MKPSYPLPEAIDGHPWSVVEGPGSVDTVNRLMLVPVGLTNADRHIKCHETAHAKITPRHSAGSLAAKYAISMDALQCCEDLRVHRYLRHCGVRTGGVLESQESSDRLIARVATTPRQVGLHLLASLYTPDYDLIKASAEKLQPPAYIAEVERRVRLVDQRMTQARSLFRPIGFRNGTAPAAALFDALLPEGVAPDDPAVPLDALRPTHHKTPSRPAKWGTMTVVVPHLSELHQVPPMSRTCNFTDEGTHLKAPHRITIDGRVFTRSRPKHGGAVLIDVSGSMSLSLADIRAIVIAAPAAIVAVYCGHGSEGTLTVVARKGRMVDHAGLSTARSYGNGNIVDGPALDWLAHQSLPRIWVSDGLVTGKRDNTHIDLSAAAQNTCHRGRIRRVPRLSPSEIAAALAGSHPLKDL